LSKLFDFGELRALITQTGAKTVIIVDTNVFMENPNFRLWKSFEKNPIFLISDRILEEILRVRRKGTLSQKTISDSKAESAADAEAARQSLMELSNLGDLSKGINVKDVGWFIKFNCPSNEKLKDEMNRLGALYDVLKSNDSIFLLLTKYCYETFNKLTVVLVTGDNELCSVCKFQGVPIYLCKKLPDQGFNDWLTEIKTGKSEIKIDWDKELTEANKRIKKESYEVSLTLISKKFVKDWPCNLPDHEVGLLKLTPMDIVLAEGYGTVKVLKDTYTFLWRIPYKPWVSDALAKDTLRGESSPIDWSNIEDENVPAEMCLGNDTDIDWLGSKDRIPQNLLDGLIFLLSDCTCPKPLLQGVPSLQSSSTLMLAFLETEISIIRGQIKVNYDFNQLRDNLINWITTHNKDEAASFVEVVTSSWNIGHTITTRIKF